jgi:hypothetical protein
MSNIRPVADSLVASTRGGESKEPLLNITQPHAATADSSDIADFLDMLP